MPAEEWAAAESENAAGAATKEEHAGAEDAACEAAKGEGGGEGKCEEEEDKNETGGEEATASQSRAGLYARALERWARGDHGGAYECWVACVKLHPSDLFAVKRAQLMGDLLLLSISSEVSTTVQYFGVRV